MADINVNNYTRESMICKVQDKADTVLYGFSLMYYDKIDMINNIIKHFLMQNTKMIICLPLI